MIEEQAGVGATPPHTRTRLSFYWAVENAPECLSIAEDLVLPHQIAPRRSPCQASRQFRGINARLRVSMCL
jgi:hypothetical protein